MKPMKSARQITLTDEERKALERWSRGRRTPARLVLRAEIVLRAAQGMMNKEIAKKLKTAPKTVSLWRTRFADHRLAGIEKDAPRGGRPPQAREQIAHEIIEKTIRETPADATHWSTRTLAKALGTSPAMVQRVWQANGLQPHRTKTFKLSNDPHFTEKLIDVVGLYLDPPEQALVLSADEKTSIQALDRTQRGLPINPGRCGTMTADYKRNGTTTLFAAIEMAGGKLIGTCMNRHRHQEWIKFLKLIDAETPAELDLHLIVDNYATHKHPKVQAWLKRHSRFHVHFTPTSSSWLNMIERWFREITVKRLRRGTFRNVAQLIAAIESFIKDHNGNPQAFTWTAQVDEILAKIERARKVLHKTPTT
jgi:transposase